MKPLPVIYIVTVAHKIHLMFHRLSQL